MQPNNLSRNTSPRWCLTIPGSLLASFRVYEAFMPAHQSVTSIPAVAPSSTIPLPPPVTWEGSWTCPEMKCRQTGWVSLHVMKHTCLWIVLNRNTTPQQYFLIIYIFIKRNIPLYKCLKITLLSFMLPRSSSRWLPLSFSTSQGYQAFSDGGSYLLISAKGTREATKAQCEAAGGSLAMFKQKEEWEDIVKLVNGE